MIFSELLNHFKIDEEFPEYLLDQTFNDVFIDGNLSKIDENYKIVIKTRQNVIHQKFIKPNDAHPVTNLYKLPNGLLNGMKFGRTRDDVTYINKL